MKEAVLKSKIALAGLTIVDFIDMTGMNRSTFYRKLKTGRLPGDGFTAADIRAIAVVLNLTPEETADIFLS